MKAEPPIVSNDRDIDRPGGRPPGKILYLEPFSGISGDMFLAALLDLGADYANLEKKLSILPLAGYRLSWARCQRAGIQAVKFDVECGEHDHHPHAHPHGSAIHEHGHEGHGHAQRSFHDIRQLIETSGLSDWVRWKSVETFRRLAEAEGKIHNQAPNDVHFHEVGAIDSIIDIVGAMIAIEELQPLYLMSAPVNVGQGELECRHGRYPAPGPAALELLKRVPVYANAVAGELTTPTGAALLASLCERFGPRPMMNVERIGYGAGAREIPGAANVLRVTLGEEVMCAPASLSAGQVAVIEATVDDMSPQLFGHFQEKALAEGALDVYAIPAQMKKNRPGMKITVICGPEPSRIEAMTRLMFAETTTIGARYYFAQRKTLAREFQKVVTEYGEVTVKVSSLAGTRMNFAPEYDCCRRLAQEKGAALKDVMAAAVRAFLELGPNF